MNRRTFVASLGGLTIAGGVAFGSAAFEQVDAAREVTVSTAADDGALLRLAPGPGDHAGFVSGHGTGAVTIAIESVDNGVSQPGAGVNDGAVTALPQLLTIQNQGSQPVEVSVDVPPDGGVVLFSEAGFSAPDSIDELQTPLMPGSSTEAGLAIDAGYGTDQIPGTLSDGDSIEIVIRATAGES